MKKDILRWEPGALNVSGVHYFRSGWNFTMEAPVDAQVSLLLYDSDTSEPSYEIEFDETMRFGRVRSLMITGITSGICSYNYRINGRVYQDPCAVGIIGREEFGAAFDVGEHEIRCILPSYRKKTWKTDTAPNIALQDMILYKLHVRGFSMEAGKTVRHKGTFLGLKESIPYLKELGINAVLLMPCYEFMEVEKPAVRTGMVSQKKESDRINFWGYKKGYYFAPKRSYCATENPEKEVCDLIRALHENHIECLMEFYIPEDVNSMEALAALRHWRLQYHVDGFYIMGSQKLQTLAARDGILAESKLFLSDEEALSKNVGEQRRFAKFNHGFWTDIRRFLKSDEGIVRAALEGISNNNNDHGIINYLTSQDGFTMRDMVSYNDRHNEANGQENRDGCNMNFSWNCGVEGPSNKIAVRRIREKQVRNAFALLLLSQGIPMIYAGDEFGNSQNGNNNAWCQDNEIGWVNWSGKRKNQSLFRYVKQLIEFRRSHEVFHLSTALSGTDFRAKGIPDISFHGERAWMVNYESSSRMFGVLYNESYAKLLNGEEKNEFSPEDALYIAYNFHWEEKNLALPNLPEDSEWVEILNTFDRESFSNQRNVYTRFVNVSPRSIKILTGRRKLIDEHQRTSENSADT